MKTKQQHHNMKKHYKKGLTHNDKYEAFWKDYLKKQSNVRQLRITTQNYHGKCQKHILNRLLVKQKSPWGLWKWCCHASLSKMADALKCAAATSSYSYTWGWHHLLAECQRLGCIYSYESCSVVHEVKMTDFLSPKCGVHLEKVHCWLPPVEQLTFDLMLC